MHIVRNGVNDLQKQIFFCPFLYKKRSSMNEALNDEGYLRELICYQYQRSAVCVSSKGGNDV